MSLVSSLVDRSGDFGHRCARAWSMLILKTTGVRVNVSGMDHLDPARTYVFASNHQSIYDIPIVFASLPFQLRIVAKESLGRIPFLGWHLARTGHLLVDRSKPGAGVVKKMARLVSEHHSLIVFPEGTRSVDGTVGRFKGGSFVLAIDSRSADRAAEHCRQPVRDDQRAADGSSWRCHGHRSRAGRDGDAFARRCPRRRQPRSRSRFAAASTNRNRRRLAAVGIIFVCEYARDRHYCRRRRRAPDACGPTQTAARARRADDSGPQRQRVRFASVGL